MKLSELIRKGFVRNPNLWIGDGHLYCSECERYTLQEAYSLHEPNGLRTDVEVCLACKTVPKHQLSRIKE
jgi:hypothetical protein